MQGRKKENKQFKSVTLLLQNPASKVKSGKCLLIVFFRLACIFLLSSLIFGLKTSFFSKLFTFSESVQLEGRHFCYKNSPI